VHAEGADAGRALGEIELLLERNFDEE